MPEPCGGGAGVGTRRFHELVHQRHSQVLAAGPEVQPEPLEVKLDTVEVEAGADLLEQAHEMPAHLRLLVVEAVVESPLRVGFPEGAVAGVVGPVRVVVVVHPHRHPGAQAAPACPLEHVGRVLDAAL